MIDCCWLNSAYSVLSAAGFGIHCYVCLAMGDTLVCLQPALLCPVRLFDKCAALLRAFFERNKGCVMGDASLL